MNITSIRIYTPVNWSGIPSEEWIELPLTDIDPNYNYIVKGITGLEPPPSVSSTYARNLTNNFGVTSDKVIDILLGLKPTYGSGGVTLSDLRDKFYKMMSWPGNQKLHVRLYNGNDEVARVDARLDRTEPGLFAGEGELLITLTCDSPLLISPDKVELYTAGSLDANWTPQDNVEFYTEDVVGGGGSTYATYIDELSTAPHGFYLELEFIPAWTWFIEIGTVFADEVVSKFRVGYAFASGHRLVIDSRYGQFKVSRKTSIDGGLTWSEGDIMSSISPDSIWPAIYPGTNVFKLPNNSGYNIIDWHHYRNYWGV